MAVEQQSNETYIAKLAFNKKISIEQNFAQQSYMVFRDIKFGITPACEGNFESAAITHSISNWKYSKSFKRVWNTNVDNTYVAPTSELNSIPATCPPTPTNVCTIIDLENLINKGCTYTQCFTLPILVWTITHNLELFPSVTVADTNNTVVEAETIYINNNVIQITFSTPFAGCAYLN